MVVFDEFLEEKVVDILTPTTFDLYCIFVLLYQICNVHRSDPNKHPVSKKLATTEGAFISLI